jgi:hypothetical protein
VVSVPELGSLQSTVYATTLKVAVEAWDFLLSEMHTGPEGWTFPSLLFASISSSLSFHSTNRSKPLVQLCFAVFTAQNKERIFICNLQQWNPSCFLGSIIYEVTLGLCIASRLIMLCFWGISLFIMLYFQYSNRNCRASSIVGIPHIWWLAPIMEGALKYVKLVLFMVS